MNTEEYKQVLGFIINATPHSSDELEEADVCSIRFFLTSLLLDHIRDKELIKKGTVILE